VLYCKYFGFSFFKARLTDIHALFPLNILGAVSIFLVSILAIIAASIIAYYDTEKSQLFILAIDSVLVTVLMFIFLSKRGNIFMLLLLIMSAAFF
jgi:hypothetical protein